MRPTATFLLLCACGGSKDSTPPAGGTPAGGPEDSSITTSSGAAGGTVGGSPTGTPTGTTTPAVDFCPPWPAATGTTVVLAPTDPTPLQASLDALSPGDTALLATGTWSLTAPLRLTIPGVTIRSQSGNRADVVLDGTDTASAIFQVVASDVVIASLTATNAAGDGVRVVPEGADLTGPMLYDLELLDNSQFGVFVDADANAFFADGGTLACSHVGLTAAGRARVDNGCTTAGVEALRARDWTVTDSTIEGYWCPSGNAPAGVRFWRGSRDTRIQRSRVLESRRGIVLGFGTDVIVRSYGDAPCGGLQTQHYGGKLHNNLVWADDTDLITSLGGLVDGIALESACEVEVLHNTLHVAAATNGDLVHRYPNTSGVVANNLSQGTNRRLDGAVTLATNNVENAGDYTWVHVPSGDFHLAPGVTPAVDAGDPAYLTAVPDDADGLPRDALPDCGLDERAP